MQLAGRQVEMDPHAVTPVQLAGRHAEMDPHAVTPAMRWSTASPPGDPVTSSS